MTARYLTLIAACLTATPLFAQTQPGAADAAAAGEKVRRDLNSIFRPGASLEDVPYVDMTAARGRLRTRPYATSVAGLCRRDEVIVSYAGPEPRSTTATERATEPFGVAAESWYRVLRDAPGGVNPGRPLDGECRALDGSETRGWFISPDVYVAADGYRTFAATLRQLSDPGHRIAGCRESPQVRRSCQGSLPASALERIARIDPCQAQPPRFCFAITTTDDSIVTIRIRYNGRGDAEIERVNIEGPAIMI